MYLLRRQHLIATGLLFAALIFVASIACGSLQDEMENGGRNSNELPEPPGFAFTVLQGEEALGGTDLMLSERATQGKPMIVNFWGSLCPPCIKEIPEFQSLYEERMTQLLLLGMDVGHPVGMGSGNEGDAFVQELGITYQIATVPNARYLLKYK